MVCKYLWGYLNIHIHVINNHTIQSLPHMAINIYTTYSMKKHESHIHGNVCSNKLHFFHLFQSIKIAVIWKHENFVVQTNLPPIRPDNYHIYSAIRWGFLSPKVPTICKWVIYILLLPYKFYVLGYIGLSKQCRPRSDCFWRSSLIRVFTICHSISIFWMH